MKVLVLFLFAFTYLDAPEKHQNLLEDNYIFNLLWGSILETESNSLHFRGGKIVVSVKGAVGIAQVMTNTFNEEISNTCYKPTDITNKEINELIGKRYFYKLYFYKYRHNKTRAISSYFMGPHNKKISYNYVEKVLKNFRKKFDINNN